MMKIWFALFLFLAPVACSVIPTRLPTSQELDRGGCYSARERERIERGRILAVTECAQCHRMYGPEQLAAEQWPEVMRDMGRRASLSPHDIEAITLYFQIAAQQLAVQADQTPITRR